MNPKLKRNTLRFGGSALKYLAIFAIFFFLLFPVYWMLTTSLKTNIESPPSGRRASTLTATSR